VPALAATYSADHGLGCRKMKIFFGSFLMIGSLLTGCQMTPRASETAAPVVPEATSCTMDVQACPDGSYVSRDPAKNCAFRPCPAVSQISQ